MLHKGMHRTDCIPLMSRLLAKVIVNIMTECWEWQGALNSKGYGNIGIGSRTNGTRRVILAHRASYETFIGPIPNGLDLLHSCDIPPCINPFHLFPGTPKDNTQDMIAKGRQVVLRGIDVKTSVLTEDKVRSIKSLFGTMNDCALERQFQVSDTLIWNIRHGLSWKHI